MPFAGLAVVAKYPLWVKLPGKRFAGVEQNAVILGAVTHRVAARLVIPIFKIQDVV